MDRMAAEEQASQMQNAEEARQLRLLDIQQKMAALQPRKTETIKGVPDLAARPPMAPEAVASLGEPTAAESAQEITTAPPPVDLQVSLPQQTQKITVAGQTIDVPLQSRTDIEEQQSRDFLRQIQQARQLEMAKGATEVTPEMVGQMPEALRPFFQPGQLTTPPNPASFLAAQERGQQRPNLAQIEAEAEARARGGRKGAPPVSTREPGAMSPQTQRTLNQTTSQFEKDTVMQQAGQGATIKAIADSVIASPADATKQLAALYILVKNLDPTSAVREGELSLAQATQSYIQQWGNELARIGQGRVMSPDAAVALAKSTKEIASLWDQAAQRREKQYRAKAGVLGIGPQFEEYLGGFANTYGQSEAPAGGTEWIRDPSGRLVPRQ